MLMKLKNFVGDKLKNSNGDKTQNSNYDKTKKLKMLHNSTNQILTISNCDQNKILTKLK